ncbi:replication protein A 32 kDa subunit B-like [Iris pallida]|uniref:Replication protein A 32 kDa subunit B-like n=1 Tax=Iris pallida TaxID=29817 RepID=A0AAX6E0K9_IRIPA|nr:replication protein A 32 kDa subunit B-like [Iris pallida]
MVLRKMTAHIEGGKKETYYFGFARPLKEYISFVVDAIVKSGTMRQMEAFRTCFNQM